MMTKKCKQCGKSRTHKFQVKWNSGGEKGRIETGLDGVSESVSAPDGDGVFRWFRGISRQEEREEGKTDKTPRP